MISLRLAFAMLVTTTIPVLADEGMWLFNNPPLKQFKEKYQFEPTPQWLDHLQKSSVRFNSGGRKSRRSAAIDPSIHSYSAASYRQKCW